MVDEKVRKVEKPLEAEAKPEQWHPEVQLVSWNTVTNVATRALLNMALHKPRPIQKSCAGSAQSSSCHSALEIIFYSGFCCKGKDYNAKIRILLILQNYIKAACV